MIPLSQVAPTIAAVVAGLGLTYKIVQDRREKKRRVRVKLSHGIPTYGANLGPDVMLVEAMNPGSQPVTLTSFGILLPNKSTLVCPHGAAGVELPYELPAGKNCIKWMETIPVAQSLLQAGFRGKIKLIGFYDDALGVRHKSKRLEFNVVM